MVSPGEVYEHYRRGHNYQVLALAQLKSDSSVHVVYRGLYNSEDFGSYPVWMRTLESFTATVDEGGYRGNRFTRVNELPIPSFNSLPMRHYKGKSYLLLLDGVRHCKDLSLYVLYQANYGDGSYEDKTLWLRPRDNFFADVNHRGISMPRFTFQRFF